MSRKKQSQTKATPKSGKAVAKKKLQKKIDETAQDFSMENFGVLPDRDLKKNLGCG